MSDICKLIRLSTDHISATAQEYLRRQGLANAISKRGDAMVAATGYGWFVYCLEDIDEIFPADLLAVLDWARKTHGVDYVLFDQDWEPTADLPLAEEESIDV